MKPSAFSASIPVLALLAITGCSGGSGLPSDEITGGGTGGGDPTDPVIPPSDLNIASSADSAAYYNNVLTDFSAVRTAAAAPDPTVFATMPPLGTVTYNGYMNLIMGDATVSANVIGAATLEASFGTGAITGAATDFMGVTTDENDNTHVAHYEGTVTITDGDIFAGTDGTTDLDIDILGQLDNGLHVFGVDGNLVGGFNGPNAETLTGLGSNTGIHGNITTTIDGAAGTIGIATISAMTP